MTTTTETSGKTSKVKARLEARIDPELDELLVEAAKLTHVTKTAFVCEAAREAALKVMARADVTLMDPEVFDRMMNSLDVPDESPELERLVAQPRQIAW